MKHAAEFATGLVAGFLDIPAPDVALCIQDDGDVIKDAINAAEALKAKNATLVFEDLDNLVGSLVAAQQKCGTAVSELVKVKDLLASIKSIKELLTTAWKNIEENHHEIFAMFEAAADLLKDEKFGDAGVKVGEALEVVILNYKQ